jgi:hypothetical protein
MKSILLLAIATAGSMTGPVAHFHTAGADFALQLPAGYCEPRDSFIDVAQAVASLDNANVTIFTAFACDAKGLKADNPLLIKTPKEALLARLDRNTINAEMQAEFNKPEFKAMTESGNIETEAAKSIKDVLKTDVELKTQIKPVGQDAVCNYLGGTLALANAGKTSVGAMAACLTVVNQRLLIIYMYSDYVGQPSIAALLPRVRAVADDMIARNEMK